MQAILWSAARPSLAATFGTTRPASSSAAFHSVNAASISEMSAPRSARRIGWPASGSTRYWYQVISQANVSTSSLFTPESGTIETSGAPSAFATPSIVRRKRLALKRSAASTSAASESVSRRSTGSGTTGLRLAVRDAEELRPARALPARPRRGERRRHRAALAHPAVVERDVLAERADVDELDAVRARSEARPPPAATSARTPRTRGARSPSSRASCGP